MKFEILNLYYGGTFYLFPKSDNFDLISLGNINLQKENTKNQSCCFQHNNGFNYHGIENALCGKTYEKGKRFIPKRILVIQMK